MEMEDIAIERSDFLASLAEPMLVWDPYADRLIDANPAACRRLGYERDELLRLSAWDLHAHEMPALITFTQAVFDKGYGWTNELSCRSKSGELLPVDYSASLHRANDRSYVIALMRDRAALKAQQLKAEANDYVRRGISEWKRIEQIFRDIEQENRLILRAVGDGIYGINADGKTTFVNPAAERLLGWKAEELVGRDIHSMIHHTRPDGSIFPSHECPIYAAFHDGEIHHVHDECFWRKDGTAIPVEYTSTPIEDRGRPVGAVVIFRDISDRRRAETDLRAAIDEVEQLKKRLELENAYLQEEFLTEHNYKEIVGRSPPIQKIIRQIELVAPTDANVLITGESGTGKELIARAIHQGGQRRERPLIRVNCAAIPRELFESEFFGHVRGAFTGAIHERAGRFELADGGTIFLDEVGEIPIELQSKLLRVLQEGQFERVGENRTRKVNVRVIAATNRDLRREIRAKRFREDLYFRLNVFPIESASLRERAEDIPLLAMHFLEHACARLNKPDVRVTHADMERLMQYPWPGNIRELQNVIERAVILSQHNRVVLDLPSIDAAPGRVLERRELEARPTKLLTRAELARRERENIERALALAGGRIFGPDGAAELLDMKPTTLASKISRLGIARDTFKRSGAAATRVPERA